MMLVQESQRIRIQNALVTLGRAGKFFKVAYDKETGLLPQIDFLSSTDLAVPKSALANETLSNFGEDKDYRIGLTDRRTTWTFDLMLDFDEEVCAEYFEESVIRNPMILASDASKGLKQVTLRLVRNLPAHPIQQQASSGSHLRLAFNAEVGRM